jgi:4-alpha-glucanotransferase
MKAADRRMAMKYLNRSDFSSDKDIARSFIKLAMSSVSKLCVIPMQDWLALDTRARINMPSTLGGNWVWRMKSGAFTKKLAKDIREITKLYARLPEKGRK